MLLLDGVCDFKGRRPTFHRAPRPTRAELTKLLHTIGQRVARLLERLGPLVRDADSDHLDFEPGEAFDRLVGASIHYRIAIGPNADRKALTLRTVPVQPEPFPSTLLAGRRALRSTATVCEAAQRDKLEKLCRHIARPAIANERLSTNDRGQVIYRFKQPFRDGSTHVVLDPLDFIARLAALVPRPRLNLTRFHGVFAPNCKQSPSCQNANLATKSRISPLPPCGAPMASKCTAQLLADLGVTRSLGRPRVSDDNPFSEAQFKTLKYHPGFPGRFHDITAAIAFCRTFFPWYNTEHRHGGIAMLTPDDVHHHRTRSVLDQRGRTLQAAWTRHPERFVRGVPKPDPLPEAVWINPPVTSTTGGTAQ